jgi:hypothetical protein
MSSSSKFTFPHETLTPLIGKPTNTTLQLMQRQLFTNARSVPSSRGGGVHGHLAMLLSDADYLARAGVAFDVPVHPGPPPLPVGAAAVIAVAIRTYTEALADVTLYNNLRAALTAQILTAVNLSFLSALEEPDFGFSNVTPRAMLDHLRLEYGTLTPEELENNRAALSEPWNLDDPIEDLWAKIANIQRVATFGNVPIVDITIITLTLAMIKKQVSSRPLQRNFVCARFRNGPWPCSSPSFNSATRNASGASPLAMPAFTAPTLPFKLLLSPLARHPSLLPPPPSLLPSRHNLRLAISPSKAAKCTIAGHTASANTAITLLSRVYIKLPVTKMMPLLFICVAATTLSPPGAHGNLPALTPPPPTHPTDGAGSLHRQQL